MKNSAYEQTEVGRLRRLCKFGSQTRVSALKGFKGTPCRVGKGGIYHGKNEVVFTWEKLGKRFWRVKLGKT